VVGGRTLGTLELDFDVTVVGAGVIGLAVAARLSRSGRTVLVIERHDGICRESSSRNSEVVHAGLYYPQGSLKARSCVAGRLALYERCDRLGIAAPRVGKYIVAINEDEIPKLEDLARRGHDNGVDDLVLLDEAGLRAAEAQVAGIAALWSPSSGIVDSHAYAASFQAEAESRGAELVFHTEVVAAEPSQGGYRLATQLGDGSTYSVTSRAVVNAAGLFQDRLSERVGLDVDSAGYRQHPCKGDYFSIAPRHRGRVKSLVYPVGGAAGSGLGVHLCLDIGGGMRLGPDANYIDGPPYSLAVDASSRDAFHAAGVALLPWLERNDLQPDLAGVRAKLRPPGGSFRDFVVQEESARGLPLWVTLAGIESPGLTAASSLADEVYELLTDQQF